MNAVMAAFSSCTLRWTPALDLLVGKQREPALHLVKPGSAGGREMQVIAGVSSEPGSDRRCLVGGVIVEHQVDVEIGWHGLFDRGQEPAEFDGAVALVATADDPAGGDVKNREQRGRAVALVVMTASLDLSRSHRQQRLRAVERLNLDFSSTHKTRAWAGGLR
jgi:hypothetical protein